MCLLARGLAARYPRLVSELRDVALVVGPGRESQPALIERAKLFGIDITSMTEYSVIHMRCALDDAAIEEIAQRLLVNPVDGWWVHHLDVEDSQARAGGDKVAIETGLRPGVTDREGVEFVRACGQLGHDIQDATIAKRYVVELAGAAADMSCDLSAGPAGCSQEDTASHADQLKTLAQRVLHNDVIERWAFGALPAAFTDPGAKAAKTETLTIIGLDEDGLAELNKSRRLGLDPEEMLLIRDHFTELGRNPNDAELETLAQTWSEHCAHKTFRADIELEHTDGTKEHIDGLLKSFLRKATDEIDADWVQSAFVDNAGIVAFDDEYSLALKAETHNHPSALEPFGGANTGVGGVIRDILGVSAKPIALSDYLCFGPLDVDPAELPEGVLHASTIRQGVIAGIGDYGNKIGVANIAGAVVHDPGYTTTPLVFAGCFGVLPTGSNPTNAQAGDSIVVLGGAVGRDGVGGATFSSQTMGTETAEVAGSSVQIGDPIVEKGLIDMVLEAREQKLYSAITDCGAGGLSSAVGEMAEELGAWVDLELVPRKYPGLAPWETWLSEAQERMVIACADPAPVLELAKRWSVGAAVIGKFTGDGRLNVVDGDDTLIDIDCGFLHDGRPKRQMVATAPETTRPTRSAPDLAATDAEATREALLGLLSHLSIRSNEDVVRSYDHEIMGSTYVRPYGGVHHDGPADGTVIIPPGTDGTRGFALGIGINAVIGRHDPYAMAWNVIDEAVRNVVIAGANPKQLSMLDNFSWGNPTIPERLGGLVEACRACRDASLEYVAPFVSGKDSLYNEFVWPDGTLDPVAPTLVITAVGIVENLDVVPHTGVCEVGNEIWLVGPAEGSLGASHLDEVLGTDGGGAVAPVDKEAISRAHQVAEAISAGLVQSAHDLSEGGLAVACAEWAFSSRLGISLDVEQKDAVFFGEHMGRYLIEVTPANAQRFAELVPSATRVGAVTGDDQVRLGDFSISIEDVAEAYTGHIQSLADKNKTSAEAVKPAAADAAKAADHQVAIHDGTNSPKVLIPVAFGSNRDYDLSVAFEGAGAVAERVPVHAIKEGEVKISDYQMLAIPGGFSYGDALGAGKLLGLDLTTWFSDQLRYALESEMPIFGVCNGFQALVSAGILPGATAAGEARPAVLAHNEPAGFTCHWVDLAATSKRCIWTRELTELIHCPVAHGEGQFISADLTALENSDQVAFRYVNTDGTAANGQRPANPNGSAGDVAGICDETGLVLGMMPHPEDHVLTRQDPRRGRGHNQFRTALPLFKAGVAAVKE